MVSISTPSLGRRLGVLATLIAAVLLFTLPSAFALAKGKKTQGKVTAVTATSITIEAKKTGSATFTFAPSTTVLLEGKTAKVSDITVGMRVRIGSEDGKTATSVETVVRKKKAVPATPAVPVVPVTPPAAAPPATPPATAP